MRRLRRWLLAVFLVLATLAIAAGAWLVIDRRLGSREWERYRAAALARGEKLTFAEYLPPPVPPEDNYTSGTIFDIRSETDTDSASFDRFKIPAAKGMVEAVSMEERLEQTKAAMIEAGWLDANQGALKASEAVLAGLERFQPTLGALRAARSRPRSHFPRSGAPPPGTDFRSISCVTAVSKLWSKHMEALLVIGQSDAALEDLRDGIRLYEALRNEPAMISALVRLSLLHGMFEAIDRGLAERGWKTQDLVQIQALLAKVDLASDARHAFASEKGFVNDTALAVGLSFRERVDKLEDIAFMEQLTSEWRVWVSVCSGDGYRWLIQQNHILDSRIAQFRDGLDSVFESVPSVDPDAKVLLTDITGMLSKRYVAVEMKRRFSRLVCALERYRMEHAAYPTTLDQLVPTFIEAVPNDVIDGKAVRYRTGGDKGFHLYSIGANSRDDQGSAAPDRDAKKPLEAPDWVWGENWNEPKGATSKK